MSFVEARIFIVLQIQPLNPRQRTQAPTTIASEVHFMKTKPKKEKSNREERKKKTIFQKQ